MENSTSNRIRVGIFVFASTLLFIFTVFMVGGQQPFFTPYYRIYAKFSQVQGLASGAVVSLAGVPIGNVKTIRFSEQDRTIEVEISIEQRYQKQITRNSSAEIKTQGALGDKYIYITQGEPSDLILAQGDFIKVRGDSDILTILADEGDSFREIFSIIREVHTLLRNVNGDGRSALIMENLKNTSIDLRTLVGESKTLVQNLHQKGRTVENISDSADALAKILKKIDAGQGTLGALINDSSLHEQLSKILGSQPRQQYLNSLMRKSLQKSEEMRSVEETKRAK